MRYSIDAIRSLESYTLKLNPERVKEDDPSIKPDPKPEVPAT
jgi:hypothetical protein